MALGSACARARPTRPVPLVPARNRWVTPIAAGIDGALATDDERIFASTREGLLALHRLSGSVAWKRPGLVGALTARPGLLIVRSGKGTVWAVDPATQETRWSAETGCAGPLPAVFDGDRVLIVGATLVVLDVETGRPLRTTTLPAPAMTAPVVAPGCLLIGESDNALRCHDLTDGSARWSFPLRQPLLAPPATDADGHVFVGTADRRMLALKLTTGQQQWRWKLGAAVPQAPTVWGPYVLIATNEAVVYAFDRGNGHLAWRAPLPSRPLSRPLVVDDQVLVACHEHDLVGMDVNTGRARARSEASVVRLDPAAGKSEIRTPPLLVERMVYVAVRNPWAVLALEPGLPQAFPSPPELAPDAEPLPDSSAVPRGVPQS